MIEMDNGNSFEEAAIAIEATSEKSKMNYLREVCQRYLFVELILFLYLAPGHLNYSAIEIFKRCMACPSMCTVIHDAYINGSIGEINFKRNCTGGHAKIVDLRLLYCKEIDIIFPLIILCFAGGWIDRYNKHKTFMMLPILGNCLFFVCQLLASLFLKDIPWKFAVYSSMLINLFGGKICFMMSVYSYIAISTSAKDRTLRFVSCAIVEKLAILVIYFCESSYKVFGYTTSFAIGACCQIAALIYIVMILKEPKSSQIIDINEPSVSILTGNNMCTQFFDLKLLKDLMKVPIIRRKNNGRCILQLLILAYFLTSQNENIIKDKEWRFSSAFYIFYEGGDIYIFVIPASAIMGIFVGYLLLSKLIKLSDSVMGMLISSITAMFRLAPVFLDMALIIYVTVIFEGAAMIRYIPIQSIASTISNDYGKLFSLFAILKYFGEAFFERIRDIIISNNTLSFVEVFLNLSIGLIFMACYFLIRRQNTKLTQKDGTNEQQDSKNI